jgi:hypothetical protein
VSHEDWLVTFAAIAGDTDVKERLLKGTTINGRNYRAHLDGYNQLDYLTGKVKASPRNEFFYVNDGGQIVALPYQDLKALFLENRGTFERAQHNATTYDDWFLDRVCILAPLNGIAAEFPLSMKDYPLSATPGAFSLEKFQKQIEASMGGQ